MHVLMTVNAAWNIWNFRRPLVAALLDDGCRVTVLAPPDESVDDLVRLGCRFLPLTMNVKGLNPLDDLNLRRRFERILRREKPRRRAELHHQEQHFWCDGSAVGRRSVHSDGDRARHRVPVGWPAAGRGWRSSHARLPQASGGVLPEHDDRALFTKKGLVAPEKARTLPGSGIDLCRFQPMAMPPASEPPVFLLIARLPARQGVVEFVEAAPGEGQLPCALPTAGAAQSENRTAIDAATVQGWVMKASSNIWASCLTCVRRSPPRIVSCFPHTGKVRRAR